MLRGWPFTSICRCTGLCLTMCLGNNGLSSSTSSFKASGLGVCVASTLKHALLGHAPPRSENGVFPVATVQRTYMYN